MVTVLSTCTVMVVLKEVLLSDYHTTSFELQIVFLSSSNIRYIPIWNDLGTRIQDRVHLWMKAICITLRFQCTTSCMFQLLRISAGNNLLNITWIHAISSPGCFANPSSARIWAKPCFHYGREWRFSDQMVKGISRIL